jgi:hypothetical protein
LKLSVRTTTVLAVIFTLVCFGVALSELSALGEITDPAQKADAKGFALLWAFLGLVAAGVAALSIWMMRARKTGHAD